MSRYNFQGKTVWISGASSGIGESLAYEFSKQGATLILSARREDRLEKVRLNCHHSNLVETIPLDIKNNNKLLSAVEKVEKSGHLDLLIHNVGIAQKGLVKDNIMEIERSIMETNYFGTIALTKAVLPIFFKQKKGWFAVITSISGIIGVPGRSIYSASKHALHGFFESLRAEVHPQNIKISMVMPGFINTDITRKEYESDGKPHGKLEKSHKLGMNPDKCAKIIIRGLQKKRKNILVGGFELTGVYVRRFMPVLYDYLIRNHPMKNWRKLKGLFKRKKHSISH